MNQLMRFEDLREWLMSQIDGSEETRGDDGLISDFIRQIDALPSEITEPRGCPTPGACSAVEELADLKQRLLPQYLGRAGRAENERDALLEQLIAARKTINQIKLEWEPPPSATAAPVAWMYEENGERMFGHPDGYRPKDAVPLYAAPVEDIAPDRPDWAQQLPGAELYDRDHGYDRTASLSAGHYVCTCAAGRVLHEKTCATRRPDAQQQQEKS